MNKFTIEKENKLLLAKLVDLRNDLVQVKGAIDLAKNIIVDSSEYNWALDMLEAIENKITNDLCNNSDDFVEKYFESCVPCEHNFKMVDKGHYQYYVCSKCKTEC